VSTTGKVFTAIGTVTVAFLAFGFYVASTPDGQARNGERDAIDHCWSQQARKSNSPGTAQAVAGVCESLESDFRHKWNLEP
jgi:hypothetical protein